MAAPLNFLNIAIDDVTWTAVAVTHDCDYLSLFNAGSASVKLRSDPNDADTEIRLASGAQQVVVAPPRAYHYPDHRFHNGDAVLYAQSSTGVGQLQLQMLL